jgi:AraC-like DNA-binding protein
MRLNLNVASREDASWPLRLGRRYSAATHGPLGFAFLSAPTLEEGIAIAERFAHVRIPLFRFESQRRDGDCFSLSVRERSSLPEALRVPFLTLTMLSLQGLVAAIIGRRLLETRVQFAFARPRDAEICAREFHGSVRFDAPVTAFEMPGSWLGHASPMTDPLSYRTSMQQLESLDRRLESDDHIVASVEQMLETEPAATLSLAEAASRLHLSERTLTRRLCTHGTTYGEILEAHRRRQAETLLRDPHLGLAEIGHRLGYSDPANFGRAFRRWYGSSPRAYRRRLELSRNG